MRARFRRVPRGTFCGYRQPKIGAAKCEWFSFASGLALVDFDDQEKLNNNHYHWADRADNFHLHFEAYQLRLFFLFSHFFSSLSLSCWACVPRIALKISA